jgi:hypothetical protein
MCSGFRWGRGLVRGRDNQAEPGFPARARGSRNAGYIDMNVDAARLEACATFTSGWR